MARPSKGGKRLQACYVDSTQKSITPFCVVKEKAGDISSSSSSQEGTPCSAFTTASAVYLKTCTNERPAATVRKKQTLLAPFLDETKTASSFKVKKMEKCGVKKSKSVEAIEIEKDDASDSDGGIIEWCRQAELRSSQSQSSNQCSSDVELISSDIDNTFGLFGVSSSEDEELQSYFNAEMAELYQRSYFNELPDEIVENIFCQLPLVDLLLNLSVVCKRWHEIISNAKFLLWKKRYYSYKYCVERRDEIFELLTKEGFYKSVKVKWDLRDETELLDEDSSPSWKLVDLKMFSCHISRFMSNFRVMQKDNFELVEVLRKHSKYPVIEKFLQLREEKERQSCWSMAGLLVLVSSTVDDIREIITCLMKSSACLLHDIIECLYCVALIFLAILEKFPTFPCSSHHYRVYYALYLYENSSHCMQSSLRSAYSANVSGQQCISQYREMSDSTWLTHEQVRIMNHNTKQGDVLKIMAFAGTGKTTTLVEYTKLRPSWQFLNVAYNKTVQEHAVKKFPGNVESRTVHSLAFRAVGFKFKKKMASSLRVSNISDNLTGNEDEKKKGSHFLHAKRVVDTLQNFLTSSDACITTEHVPYQTTTAVMDYEDRLKAEYYNSEQYYKIVVRDCKDIWTKMSDPNNIEVRITHDGYLKLYQLSKPVIAGYNCILIDEAQDCTPAVSDILLNQDVAKILVGDPHQQIYGFRGATNAMAQVTASHTYYLTQSFRFGPEIASLASSLLDILKGVRSKTIVGLARQGGYLGDQVGQLAVICRTNFTLFNCAVLTCTRNNKTRIGFAGGIKGYNLDRVLDISKLYSGKAHEIKDKFIKRFKTFRELKTYAQKAPDPELLGKIKIVETHHINVPSHIEKIRKQCCRDTDQADIVFSTAHKSKGLEFDTVRLSDDFLHELPLAVLEQDMSVDEKNLLYVAVTRAKHRLQMPSMLYNILTTKTDLLLTYEPLSVVKDGSPTYCAECKQLCDFTTSFLAVKRHTVTLGTGQKMEGGYICTSCVSKQVPVLGNLV